MCALKPWRKDLEEQRTNVVFTVRVSPVVAHSSAPPYPLYIFGVEKPSKKEGGSSWSPGLVPIVVWASMNELQYIYNSPQRRDLALRSRTLIIGTQLLILRLLKWIVSQWRSPITGNTWMWVTLFHSDLLRGFPNKKTSCYFTVHICAALKLLIDFLTVFELMYSVLLITACLAMTPPILHHTVDINIKI
jgi:hypothetical protein